MKGIIPEPVSQVFSTLPQDPQTTPRSMTVDGILELRKPTSKLLLTGFHFDVPTSEFLDLNFDVAYKIPEMTNKINDIIGYEIKPQFELINDEETGEVSSMVFSYNIKNKTYEEILDLWDKISEEVYKDLDIETSKKVSIVLNGD
ncbi:MAG: hypothetical protein ACYC6W_09285 [Nitrosotalea sp.]